MIAHFEEYCGPAFCPARPKLVLLTPLTREGDCTCKCSRRSVCFRVCEGTTTHSVQGITVGAKKQVKRIGINLGPASVEQRARGLSYVAQSRPETTDDFVYMRPVSLDRLAAIGTGKGAKELHAKMDKFEANQSKDAAALIEHGYAL